MAHQRRTLHTRSIWTFSGAGLVLLAGIFIASSCLYVPPDPEKMPPDGCDVPADITYAGACGTCGTGTWECDEQGQVFCDGDVGPDAINECGGCEILTPGPGSPCGSCGAALYECTTIDSVECSGGGDCPLGSACSTNAECAPGQCSNGHCSMPNFAYIPAGTYMRGSPEGERRRVEGETLHEVTITRPFLMQENPVTQGEWYRVMGFNPSYFSNCGENCPAESMTWIESLAYANAMSKQLGLEQCYDLSECTGSPGNRLRCPLDNIDFDFDCDGFRLPTEAEREYAHRAGTTSAFYLGEVDSNSQCDQPLLDEMAHYCGNCEPHYEGGVDCGSDTRPHFPDNCGTGIVGLKTPNAWGLYDMSGNVEEFCWDRIADYPTGSVTDPKGPHSDDGGRRIVRGAGFCGHMARLRSADRKSVRPTETRRGTGFRLVRTVVAD